MEVYQLLGYSALDPDEIQPKFRNKTRLCSLSHANFMHGSYFNPENGIGMLLRNINRPILQLLITTTVRTSPTLPSKVQRLWGHAASCSMGVIRNSQNPKLHIHV
jgi:hypothetical protein